MYETSYDSTTSAAVSPAVSGVMFVAYLAVIVLAVVAMWKIFNKAGEAGWKSLIPLYNTYTLLKIAGMSGWWLLGLMVPLVNVVGAILLGLNLAKAFGRSATFGIVGLVVFSIVGFLILGFGKDTYIGPAAAAPVAPAAA